MSATAAERRFDELGALYEDVAPWSFRRCSSMARVLSPGGRLFALPLHPNHAPQSDEYARVEDAPPALHACLRRPHTTMLDCRLARVTG